MPLQMTYSVKKVGTLLQEGFRKLSTGGVEWSKFQAGFHHIEIELSASEAQSRRLLTDVRKAKNGTGRSVL